MPKRRILLVIAALAAVHLPVSSGAQAVEPQAVDALRRMGAFLETLKSFEIHADTSIDEVLESGQKLQFEDTIHLRARRPDRLWVQVASDRKTREYFYDGKSFTIYGPRNKLYASFDAPPTLREVAATLEEKYGLALPLVDLFRWGTDPLRAETLLGALYVGPARVADTPCDHFAFREKGFDWQIWIQKGDSPLPRKLVITTTDDETRPQYAVTYDWNLAPALNDAMFTFEAPAGSYRIALREITVDPAPPGN